ncbi:hypothetical protein [Rhodococcus sp. JT-3]|uniref:hypothetical protein n=1 Tax=Rhodococcus sp. JT-3 TaxID=1973213 RepID=UPI001303E652|nr:hypothetical protein [Rhodococcus sp. JT-3]
MAEPELIDDLLHRRSDLGGFIHHFTRGTPAQCEVTLLNILRGMTLVAANAWGVARDLDGATLSTSVTQRTVCFTDMPIEHSWMMVRQIAGRSWNFQPYGVVFTKAFARVKGCHPIWYVDAVGPPPSMSTAVGRLVEAYRTGITNDPANYQLENLDILRLTPFMEWRHAGQDFVWEREWRHRGNFNFDAPRNVVAVYAPENQHLRLRGQIAGLSPDWAARTIPILDPKWGSDRILQALSGAG